MALSILIAEDNQYTALQYDKILRKYGHDVTIANDGEECMKKYHEISKSSKFDSVEKNPYDVVILDQTMPKKSGSEVAKEILKEKPGQRIVFASAYGLTGEKNAEVLKERIEVLQKPFSLTKFVKTVLGQNP